MEHSLINMVTVSGEAGHARATTSTVSNGK